MLEADAAVARTERRRSSAARVRVKAAREASEARLVRASVVEAASAVVTSPTTSSPVCFQKKTTKRIQRDTVRAADAAVRAAREARAAVERVVRRARDREL